MTIESANERLQSLVDENTKLRWALNEAKDECERYFNIMQNRARQLRDCEDESARLKGLVFAGAAKAEEALCHRRAIWDHADYLCAIVAMLSHDPDRARAALLAWREHILPPA